MQADTTYRPAWCPARRTSGTIRSRRRWRCSHPVRPSLRAGLVAVGELTIHGSNGDLLAWLNKTVGSKPGPTMLLMSSEAAFHIMKWAEGVGKQLRCRLVVVEADHFSEASQVTSAEDRAGRGHNQGGARRGTGDGTTRTVATRRRGQGRRASTGGRLRRR